MPYALARMADAATTRLFLFRHGEVAEAWRGLIYGDLDVPLSPRGEAQSRAAARRLAGVPLDAVVSSGLARAEHLAACLREERGLARRDDARLREIDRGAWRGRTPEDVDRAHEQAWSAWMDDPGERRPPGGESLSELALRVRAAIGELLCEFPGGSVAIAAHSWVVRCYACQALDAPLRCAARLVLPTGGLVVVDASHDPELRPTLAGFALEEPPSAKAGWFRGPHRGR